MASMKLQQLDVLGRPHDRMGNDGGRVEITLDDSSTAARAQAMHISLGHCT